MAQVDRTIEDLAKAEFHDINLRHFNLNKEISTIEQKLEKLTQEISNFNIEVDITDKQIHEENIKVSQDPTYKSKSLKSLENQRLAKQEKLEKLFSKAYGIKDSLDIKKEQLKGLHQDFSTKVPLGENALTDVRENALGDRKKIRMDSIDNQNKTLSEQKAYIKDLDNVLDSAPLIKGAFNDMLSSYKKVLTQKAIVEAKDPKLQEDIEDLKDFEAIYNLQKSNYEKAIEDYSSLTGNESIKKVDYKILEKAISIKSNPKYVFEISSLLIRKEKENLDIEKETMIEYYDEKLKEMRQQSTPQQQISTAPEKNTAQSMPANNSLWNRFKQKFSNFINKFRKQETTQKPTQSQTQTQTSTQVSVQDEYSDEFKEVLKESAYFKEQLKVTETHEDKELKERIAEAKRKRDIKKIQENDKEIEQ